MEKAEAIQQLEAVREDLRAIRVLAGMNTPFSPRMNVIKATRLFLVRVTSAEASASILNNSRICKRYFCPALLAISSTLEEALSMNGSNLFQHLKKAESIIGGWLFDLKSVVD